MQIKSVNNQIQSNKYKNPCFGMRFEFPEDVQHEFLSQVQKFATTPSANPRINYFKCPNFVEEAKKFMSKVQKDLAMHNNNPKNHKIYDDVITITKIDALGHNMIPPQPPAERTFSFLYNPKLENKLKNPNWYFEFSLTTDRNNEVYYPAVFKSQPRFEILNRFSRLQDKMIEKLEIDKFFQS